MASTSSETARIAWNAQVLPGVALTLESRRDAVMYRFDVAPGGDPGAIRMRYGGVEDVARESDGTLSIRAGERTLRERGLHCFQEIGKARRDVSCSYHVTREDDGAFTVTLDIGSYDRARTLVIDPEISWSSYLGGTGLTDAVAGIATDAAGNIYVTGETRSSDFPITGGFDGIMGAFRDAFVTKVSTDGSSLLWSSYLGGEEGLGDDSGYGIAVDSDENVYVTGWTITPDFPSNGGFDTTLDGEQNAFVTKIDASGASIVWSSYLGGDSTQDEGRGIAVDGARNVYVTGRAHSPDFPTSGGFDTTLGGARDAFVTKVDASGASLVWSSFLGGSDTDSGSYIAVDQAGHVYVSGGTSSTDFPIVGGFDADYAGGDGFIAKIDPSGSGLLWSSYVGGSSGDGIGGMAVDRLGNVYLAGSTDSSDFPIVGGFDNSLDVAGDGFVAKVDASGSSLLWSSYLSGLSPFDGASDMTVDHDGHAYVVGWTESPDFPTPGGFDTQLDGTREAYVTKVAASGSSLVWSSFLGGSWEDQGSGIAVDGSGNVYVTGTTQSSDFPSAVGFDVTLDGSSDIFVARIAQCNTDGFCDPDEDACTCPDDCGTDACGNGCCGPSEDPCDCPGDCPGDCCGDATCGHTESACICAADCADVCGDGCCTGAEDCISCADDCPLCAEPGPEPPPDAGSDSADAGANAGDGGQAFECRATVSWSCQFGGRTSFGPGLWLFVLALWLRRRRRSQNLSRSRRTPCVICGRLQEVRSCPQDPDRRARSVRSSSARISRSSAASAGLSHRSRYVQSSRSPTVSISARRSATS